MHAVRILLLAFLFAVVAPVRANDPIFLFPPGSATIPSAELIPVDNYEEILQNLKPKDVLGFEDGARFEFVDHLGHGETNYVLKVKAVAGNQIGKIMALRLPISRQPLWVAQGWDLSEIDGSVGASYKLRLTFSHYIDATMEYADLFSRSGIGPKYHGGLKGQYNAFDVIPKSFTLDEYLSREVRFQGDEDRAIQAALGRFQWKTSGILGIQDISQPGQVIFNGRDFILVDWYGVRLVEGTIYPWGLVSLDVTGKRLFKEGMISQGLAGDVLSSYRIGVSYGSTEETRADRAWQDELEKLLNRQHSMARFDMLESGINPLTGKILIDPKTYWQRNFGIWRSVYAEKNRSKKIRKCSRLLSSEIFPIGFTP